MSEPWAPSLSLAGEATALYRFSKATYVVRSSNAHRAQVKPRYERLAKTLVGSADFYEVDYSTSKQFCFKCGVKFMPCAHVYANGELAFAVPVSAKSFSKFVARVNEQIGAMATPPDAAPPDAASDAAMPSRASP